jgi:2'-hydroxyisoflavone reductase
MQRSAARARAAGMPATPLTTMAADVLAWDLERGTPPLPHAPTAQEEARAIAASRQDAP